jgi:threonine dehydrogenase-like Zn-dependent dehydrogenase
MRAVRASERTTETAVVRVVQVDPPTGEGVRVRVASASICGSDLHLLAAFPLRATLGHEFAGWLDDGTPVAVEPLAPCGECPQCAGGDYQRCVLGPAISLGIGRDGGMADEVLVPESSLVRLPGGLAVGDACLVEPLAVAVHGVRRGRITPTDRVVVVGAGAIGLCAVAAIRAIGAKVDLVARHDHQRLVGENLGASVTVTDGYDVVVDAVGTSASLDQSIALGLPGARLLMLGTFWGGVEINGLALCMKEIEMIPSMQYNRSGPSRDVDVAAAILAADSSIAAQLITHRFPLDAAAEAFAVAADRASGAIKVVLEP